MKTQLRGKYERRFKSILDDLDEKQDMYHINNNLKNFAVPSRKSYLKNLIEKSKEIAFEIGLSLDNETSLELTDT